MTLLPSMLTLHNCQTVPLSEIPVLSPSMFRETVVFAVNTGARLSALFGVPQERLELPQAQNTGFALRLFAILAFGEEGCLAALSTNVGEAYPALTPDCSCAHWFEREIAEQWGVVPEGHPWLKPIRFHGSCRPGHDAWARPQDGAILPGVEKFFQVQGEQVHEVAVGPVHAGIIEPGHFRFQCHGEQVFHLEIALGYQHRGVERQIIGGPSPRAMAVMETLAGDTTVGHATTYCAVLESLADCAVSPRALALRGIALELERLANHTGGLGALAGDVGFLPTAAYCGRIRGDLLNLTALICGSRFGRGLVRPGGTGFELEAMRGAQLLKRLERTKLDLATAVNLLWETPSVLSRFGETGIVPKATALSLGLVGVAARACGLERDARYEFPMGIYQFVQIPVSTWHAGDVFARAYVRWLELQRSLAFVHDQLQQLGEGPVRIAVGSLKPASLAVALVEGWRGEICHVALTGREGRLAHYKIVDPSFHNWAGLALAMRAEPISDFPLCNKSFDLSYCGHDL